MEAGSLRRQRRPHGKNASADTHHAGHHAGIDGPLSEQTNRNTLIEHADHRAQGRRSRNGESRKRFSQGDLLRNLPQNLSRDRDAYVFQRRVPKSVSDQLQKQRLQRSIRRASFVSGSAR